MRPLFAAALALGPLLAPGAPARAAEPPGAWTLEADRLERGPDGWRATGAVRLEGPDGALLTAPAARFDPEADRLEAEGPLALAVPGGLEAAASALAGRPRAGRLSLADPAGTLAGRYRFAARALEQEGGAFSLLDGWWTGCRAPEPDLRLSARRLWVRPGPEETAVAWEGAWLRVGALDLLPLPPGGVTLPRGRDGRWPVDLYPVFGFDAYRGPYGGFEAAGPLGASAWRYRAPATLSLWRGGKLALGLDGPLAPGFRASGEASMETAWAQSRGGPRARAALARAGGAAGETSLVLAYRDLANFQALTRLPELRHQASFRLGPLSLSPRLEAGHLAEEDSRASAWRARLAPDVDAALPWGLRAYGRPFVGLYAPEAAFPGGAYAGGTAGLAWAASPWPGAGLELGAEAARAWGKTPFLYERLVDADRLRARLSQRLGPLELDGLYVHSRVLGLWGPEDLNLGVAWHWSCFAARLGVRPLRLGLDLHLLTVDF